MDNKTKCTIAENINLKLSFLWTKNTFTRKVLNLYFIFVLNLNIDTKHGTSEYVKQDTVIADVVQKHFYKS